MNAGRIVGFIVTFGVICMMFLSFSSSNTAVQKQLQDSPEYKAHREMLQRAGVNPDDPKAVEAYMLKMAEDIQKQQQIPAGAAKE